MLAGLEVPLNGLTFLQPSTAPIASFSVTVPS